MNEISPNQKLWPVVTFRIRRRLPGLTHSIRSRSLMRENLLTHEIQRKASNPMVNHLALSIIQAHDPEKEEGGEDRGQGYAPLHVAPTAARASRDGQVPGVMSRVATVPMGNRMGTASGTTLTGIDVRDRSTEESGDGKVFVVAYEGENDMMNPHNWSFSTRLAAT